MYRNLKQVDKVIFGHGAFNQVDDVLSTPRNDKNGAPVVFLLDAVFTGKPLQGRIPVHDKDILMLVDVEDHEPTTFLVDDLVKRIRENPSLGGFEAPSAVVGIGGGSLMDLAKAVSLLLTNPGSAADYQGWDLIKIPAVYHMGIPTLSGTGSEVSRTTVLTGPEKKLGINSDYTVFDQIILDPELIRNAPVDQRFYTGMDCYIHCVESLCGTFLNMFSRACAEKAMDMCKDVFLEDAQDGDEKLMTASYFGGLSIVYSQVGICHAVSYGLSFVLGIRHGIGNSIVFDYLDDYYPAYMDEFRRMQEKNRISLPRGICKNMEPAKMEKMVDTALGLAPLWENALGPNWKEKISRDDIRELYMKM